MNKKVMVSIICLIIAVFLFWGIWKIVDKKDDTKENLVENSETNNMVEVSEEEVTDECTEDWKEYNNELQKAFEQASNSVVEDDTHYLLKEENGYICVYYLDENSEEYLYKKTTISTEYLSQEDIDSLKEGIEVVGNEELNSMLEDFE